MYGRDLLVFETNTNLLMIIDGDDSTHRNSSYDHTIEDP